MATRQEVLESLKKLSLALSSNIDDVSRNLNSTPLFPVDISLLQAAALNNIASALHLQALATMLLDPANLEVEK